YRSTIRLERPTCSRKSPPRAADRREGQGASISEAEMDPVLLAWREKSEQAHSLLRDRRTLALRDRFSERCDGQCPRALALDRDPDRADEAIHEDRSLHHSVAGEQP